jgi:hypothetical protein
VGDAGVESVRGADRLAGALGIASGDDNTERVDSEPAGRHRAVRDTRSAAGSATPPPPTLRPSSRHYRPNCSPPSACRAKRPIDAPRPAGTSRREHKSPGLFDRATLNGPVDSTSDRDSCTVSNARAKSLSSRQVPLPWCRSAADTIRTERALSGAREGAHPPVSCAPSPAWPSGDPSARSPWIISPLLGCGRQS